MKRKELEKLPVLSATAAMRKQAENEPMEQADWFKKEWRYVHNYYARCKQFGGILKVAIYMTEALAAGGRKPLYELFLDYGAQDFLTYSFEGKKWRTAMLHNLSWHGYGFYRIRISARDTAAIRRYLHSEKDAIAAILAFQNNIRERQLLARHKKQTDPWDAAMALVPPLPKDWNRWVSKVGIEQNYMFYQYRRGGAKTGYCSYCDREVPIRKPKYNAICRCPRCKKQVQFKSLGKMGWVCTEPNFLYLIQPYPGGFVIREFWAKRKYCNTCYQNKMADYHEIRRSIFDVDRNPKTAYYWGWYKWITTRWIEGCNCTAGYCSDESGRVYGRTIPWFAKTSLRWTGLPELISAGKKIDPEKYLAVLKSVPALEQLSKAGLFRLAQECTQSPYWLRESMQKKSSQKGLASVLGIDRAKFTRLRQMDGGQSFLEWLHYENKTRTRIADHAIQWLCQEEIKPEQLNFIADRMHIGQIQHYLRRQMRETGMGSRELLGMWRDYLSMAARFGYDLSDPIVNRVRKLRQRHDELAARCKEQALALQADEIRRAFPHVEQNLEHIRRAYAFSEEAFQLQVPKSIEDILLEGRKLLHCIANSDVYWERMERRESYLLFLRKSEEPDVPYYTVEAEPDGTVRQVRTQFNRQNDDIDEIRSFLKRWQKQLARQITQEDKRLAADSRDLRIKELVQLRNDQVTIHTGELAGRLLADVLTEDLMEAA